MVATKVILSLTQTFVATTGYIHLAAENGLERFEAFFLTAFIHAITNVVKFFNTKHIAVIGNGHASHAILNSFVYKLLNTRLSIKY